LNAKSKNNEELFRRKKNVVIELALNSWWSASADLKKKIF